MNRSRGRTGSTLIEFTLVGIPLIFVLISTFEMARGMWNYQTLAYAVRAGTVTFQSHAFMRCVSDARYGTRRQLGTRQLPRKASYPLDHGSTGRSRRDSNPEFPRRARCQVDPRALA